MKQFFTQNKGVCAFALYALSCTIFLILEFSMISEISGNSKNHLSDPYFYGEFPLKPPPQEIKNQKKTAKLAFKKKNKTRIPSPTIQDANLTPLLFLSALTPTIIKQVGSKHATGIFGAFYFFILLPILTFIGHRSKSTLKEQYHLKLSKISKKISKLEKEKQDLYVYAASLKDAYKNSSPILEKIFPEQSKLFHAFEELSLCCSKEMTENFKMRLSAEGGKPQKTLVSGKSLALEVKKEFSYKIYEQDIQFKIRGEDVNIEGREALIYFVFYFLIKKTMRRLSKNGVIEIIFKNKNGAAQVVIKDNGFLFSEEIMLATGQKLHT